MFEQRMYQITLRHLSGRQQGIQGGHAGMAYVAKFHDTLECKRWEKKDKTVVLLEAHTDTQLNETYEELKKLRYPVIRFREPDLGNITTAIAFLADERVYNTTKYPDGEMPIDLALRRIKNRFPLASS